MAGTSIRQKQARKKLTWLFILFVAELKARLLHITAAYNKETNKQKKKKIATAYFISTLGKNNKRSTAK